MKHRPLRHILTLALGIFMALGTGLSLTQASGMAVDMALASESGMQGHDGCNGCPDDGGAQGACHVVCTPAIAAVMPVAPGLIVSGFRLPSPPAAVVASGWSSPPDPSPPKAATAG